MSQKLKDWAMEEMEKRGTKQRHEPVEFPPEYEQDTEELEWWKAKEAFERGES